MRFSIFFIMIVCGFFLCRTEIIAQPLNSDIRAQLLDYLTGSCEEGEEDSFVEFVQKNEQAVTPVIIKFVQDGVPKDFIKNLEATTLRLYADRQKLLNEKSNFGLSEENLEILKKESQEAFTKRMTKDFRDGFMKQTIFGLSLLRSKDAQDLLNKISTDKNHPYQRSAENALILLKKQ